MVKIQRAKPHRRECVRISETTTGCAIEYLYSWLFSLRGSAYNKGIKYKEVQKIWHCRESGTVCGRSGRTGD